MFVKEEEAATEEEAAAEGEKEAEEATAEKGEESAAEGGEKKHLSTLLITDLFSFQKRIHFHHISIR